MLESYRTFFSEVMTESCCSLLALRNC